MIRSDKAHKKKLFRVNFQKAELILWSLFIFLIVLRNFYQLKLWNYYLNSQQHQRANQQKQLKQQSRQRQIINITKPFLLILLLHQMNNMKSLINKILDEPSSQTVFKFIPQIKISSKSTLHLQIEPNDPHTASNIVINAYQSKTNRSIVPIKIEWSRYKFKSDEQFTVEKISSLGNTYMCEPSDLGSVIQAKVKCLDSSLGGEAEATIGPIRIDPLLKRLIDGALYNESLLSQIIVVEGEEKFNVNLRMGRNTMQFTELNSSQKLSMPYSFSEPKIELSPKDPCKMYLRFEQDTVNKVRGWLNKLTGEQKNSSHMNESSMSIKIPHSNVSAMSSKTKLFQRSHIHCINKLETRFLSRNSRDLFLFTLRAFICKEDMKNSLTMERIQTLQALKSEQDFNKFLEYISLKSEIIRLAEIAKDLQLDRDSKLKDIANMEESISEMTLTYLKIIQEKSQNQHVDLEQSYSMISIKRQEILGRKNLRQLKSENQKLKNHIRQLNQQIQLQKFFKKDVNQHSMVFNQTSNPFLKKQNISGILDQNQSASYYIAGQEVRPNDPTHKNMLEISKSYLKVLEENKKLKEKSGSKKGSNDQSMGIQNLLESLHESEEDEKRMAEMQGRIQCLKDEIQKLNEVNKNILKQNNTLKEKLCSMPLPMNLPVNTSSHSPLRQDNSFVSNNNTSMISNSYISMNQSMTSQAELGLLEKKLLDLANINAKFQAENTRLRRERDYFRSLYDGEQAKNKSVAPSIQAKHDLSTSKNRLNLDDSNLLHNNSDQENSLIIKLKQDKQKLQNQKNSLLKKIDSLIRQSNTFSTHKTDPNIEKRCHQLSTQNQHLIEQNQSLKKTIQNIKSFHDLQKKELQNMKLNSAGNDLMSKNEEIEKLKKVNASLLGEIKEMKIQLERKKDSNLKNSRVIQLQNQLNIFKTYAKGGNISNNLSESHPSLETDKLIEQVTQLRKQNQRLREQMSTLQLKIKTQTSTIQKLMSQIDQLHQGLNTSNASSTFNKKYLTPQNSPTKPNQQVQKYKKKLSQLQAELQILRRNSEAVNRSRDLSMSMMGYEEERLQLYKKENQSLMMEIQNLNKMCSKYSRDARQANIEVNKLREKIIQINKERLSLDQ